jgi:hypothetical protein
MFTISRSTKNGEYLIKMHKVIRWGLNRYIVLKVDENNDDWDDHETIFKLCGANEFGGRVLHQLGSVMVVDVYQEEQLKE